MSPINVPGPWAQPTEVSDLDIAFAARGPELTPDYRIVPDEFKGFGSRNPWVKFIEHWFFEGDPFAAFDVHGPKEGIDGDRAIRHLRVVMSTFGTKHEHKTAGAAWLMSLWFDSVVPKPSNALPKEDA